MNALTFKVCIRSTGLGLNIEGEYRSEKLSEIWESATNGLEVPLTEVPQNEESYDEESMLSKLIICLNDTASFAA